MNASKSHGTVLAHGECDVNWLRSGALLRLLMSNRVTGRGRDSAIYCTDSPLLGRREGLEEVLPGRKPAWTPCGSHSELLSHWLLTCLKAAAHGTIEGLGLN